jgi:acyl-CoA thioesterase I
LYVANDWAKIEGVSTHDHRGSSAMRKLWLIFLFIIAAAPAMTYAKTLLIFGDSLSAGHGLAGGEEWPALLQQRLLDQKLSIKVVNASISGETTDGGLSRLPAALKSTQPSWVILELGANDGLRGYPIKSLRANLEAMITLCEHAGARVMLVGMYVPPNYGKAYTEAFTLQFSELASERQLPFTRFLLEPVILNESLMQPDRLHPNAKAQPYILDWLWPQIAKLLDIPANIAATAKQDDKAGHSGQKTP